MNYSYEIIGGFIIAGMFICSLIAIYCCGLIIYIALKGDRG